MKTTVLNDLQVTPRSSKKRRASPKYACSHQACSGCTEVEAQRPIAQDWLSVGSRWSRRPIDQPLDQQGRRVAAGDETWTSWKVNHLGVLRWSPFYPSLFLQEEEVRTAARRSSES